MSDVTKVIAAAVGKLDENGGAGVFIKVTDSTDPTNIPTGTVTITASETSEGTSVFSSYDIALDSNGECYTWVHSQNPTDRIPLTFYANVANWYIQVVYNGDDTCASSSAEAVVPNTSFDTGE